MFTHSLPVLSLVEIQYVMLEQCSAISKMQDVAVERKRVQKVEKTDGFKKKNCSSLEKRLRLLFLQDLQLVRLKHSSLQDRSDSLLNGNLTECSDV